MLKRRARSEPATSAVVAADPALHVTTVYLDPLTRRWAARLWDQVGGLIGGGDICHKSWRIGDLAHADVFVDAVEAAAHADVLVVSLRDAELLPLSLYKWIDGWLPQRAGREGALVALIGVSAQPDAQCGHASHFLEMVARNAGLDFLPREHKLPHGRFHLSCRASAIPGIESVVALRGAEARHAPALHLHRGLSKRFSGGNWR